jgi:hypothetical protein
MPLIKGTSRGVIGANIKTELSVGRPKPQAVAIALDTARRSKRPGKLLGYLAKKK